MKQQHKNTRYYKWIDDELDVVIITRFNNESSVSIKHIKDYHHNSIEKIDINQLNSDYTELAIDGFITFSIVELTNNVTDVMVSVFRTKDVSKGDS